MFRFSDLFAQRAYPAPSNPVVDPAPRAAAAAADTFPDATRAAGAGGAGSAASARARALAASMRERGVEIPVLLEHFPHVVDRIASAWSDPRRLASVFEDLLVDDRGGRQGFPAAAAKELFVLHKASRGGAAEPAAPDAPRPARTHAR